MQKQNTLYAEKNPSKWFLKCNFYKYRYNFMIFQNSIITDQLSA